MMKRNQEILIFAERGKLENPGKTLEGHEGTNEEIHLCDTSGSGIAFDFQWRSERSHHNVTRVLQKKQV